MSQENFNSFYLGRSRTLWTLNLGRPQYAITAVNLSTSTYFAEARSSPIPVQSEWQMESIESSQNGKWNLAHRTDNVDPSNRHMVSVQFYNIGYINYMCGQRQIFHKYCNH